MALKPITVSQLNDYLARIISTDPLLSGVTVQGEASGVKYHSSGHVYFSLVDSSSRLSCFLPREYAAVMETQLKDGMELILTGGISIFKKGGSYSLYVRRLEVCGTGDLAIAFEKMKTRLAAEGLFDPAHKKPLPAFPRNIGVVTASTGAAIRDILKTIRSRNSIVNVTLFPAPVQGEGAADAIARVIDHLSEHRKDLDLLIVGRGGGSAEDLWAFNEEILARSIYRCPIPVISAVGHEIDFTISDFVADVRAATPTAAAQIGVPDTEDLRRNIDEIWTQMGRQLNNTLVYQGLIIENLIREMKTTLENRIERASALAGSYRLILTENDPRNVLAKGYSIMQDPSGTVITDAGEIDPEVIYSVTFRKGSARFRPESDIREK